MDGNIACEVNGMRDGISCGSFQTFILQGVVFLINCPPKRKSHYAVVDEGFCQARRAPSPFARRLQAAGRHAACWPLRRLQAAGRPQPAGRREACRHAACWPPRRLQTASRPQPAGRREACRHATCWVHPPPTDGQPPADCTPFFFFFFFLLHLSHSVTVSC